MSNAQLPQSVTIDFIRELNKLSLNHHEYDLERVSENNPESLKKTREDISVIKDNGYDFLFALTDLYNIMQEVEPDFFQALLSKAVLVMQSPTTINREAFRAEFEQFKKQVNEYKVSHPFSTGIGYISTSSLALVVGIALIVTAAVLLTMPFVIPGMALSIGLSFMGLVGIITAVTTVDMLANNASKQQGFFKNKQLESSESFINDIASDGFEEYLEHAKKI